MHGSKSGPDMARIVVLGASNVGKTALVIRCLTKRFLPEYVSGYDSCHMFSTTIDSRNVKLELVDSSKELESLASLADAFILVYSITNRNSLSKLHQYATTIRNSTTKKVPIAVIGNKKDLEHARKVSAEEGYKISQEINATLFTELSVADNIEKVEEIFTETYRRILKSRRKISSFKSSQKFTSQSVLSNMLMKIKPLWTDNKAKKVESAKEFETQLRLAIRAMAI